MTLTYDMISWFCGLIVMFGATAGVLYKVIKTLTKPYNEWKEHLIELDEKIESINSKIISLNERNDIDYARLNSFDSLYNIQLKATLAMVNHMIDGNHIDNLKKIRDEMQTNVIDTIVPPIV